MNAPAQAIDPHKITEKPTQEVEQIVDEWDAQEQREAREEQTRWENRDNEELSDQSTDS